MKKLFLILVILTLFLTVTPIVNGASGSLYLAPSTGVYTVGNNFSVDVRINTGGTSINAAQGTLVFSPDKLSVVGLSKSGSIFNLWTTEPIYSNSLGIISFGGGVPNPGYTGSSGKVISITFKAKVSGIASVNWSSGAILANDGKGTNILASMGGGNYTFSPSVVVPAPEPTPLGVPATPEIISSTHPNEDEWYPNSDIEFSWSFPIDVTGVSILLNQKANSNPGPLSDGLFDFKKYTNVDDGVWYLHLKFKNNYGWSPIRHFRVQIDTEPPSPFVVKIEEGQETDNPQPTLFFETEDDLSGISHYRIRLNGDRSLASIFEDETLEMVEEVVEGSYKLPPRAPGKHTIIVEAFDKAGNNTANVVEVTILAIESPYITEYPQRLSLDKNLVIKGTSMPGRIIKVYIQKEGLDTVIGETNTNEGGIWLYAHDKFLSKGTYKVYAIAVDEKKARSFPSNEVNILVTLPALFSVGNVVIDYITIIIVLIALIAVIVFGVYWTWHKFKLFRKRLVKETKDVEKILHKSFNLLKGDVEEQLKKLEKIKNRRELNEKEEEIEKQLKKDLKIAEKYIRKEIKDVEDKIKKP